MATNWFYGRMVYVGFLDLYLALVVAAGVTYLRSSNPVFFAIELTASTLLLPTLFGTELLIQYHWYRNNKLTGYYIENVHQPNKTKGWEPVQNSVGFHSSHGNFNVRYEFDELGRKLIAQKREANLTIHVFGDSFAFGHGVTNEETGLNILAARIGTSTNIQNYSVMGYGLEQMLVRLNENKREIKSGDLVLFLPTAVDIRRNLIDKRFVCWEYFDHAREDSGLKFRYFPKLVSGRLKMVDVSKECGFVRYLLMASRMPFGIMYNAHTTPTKQQLILNGNRVLRIAQMIAEQRNAHFLVVIVTRPSECLERRHEVEWDGIQGRVLSLMPYCPSDPEIVAGLHFPTDGHLSKRGNTWLALSLRDLLEKQGYLKQ